MRGGGGRSFRCVLCWNNDSHQVLTLIILALMVSQQKFTTEGLIVAARITKRKYDRYDGYHVV